MKYLTIIAGTSVFLLTGCSTDTWSQSIWSQDATCFGRSFADPDVQKEAENYCAAQTKEIDQQALASRAFPESIMKPSCSSWGRAMSLCPRVAIGQQSYGIKELSITRHRLWRPISTRWLARMVTSMLANTHRRKAHPTNSGKENGMHLAMHPK